MVSQQRVLGLISRIYEAAANRALWPNFLEELRQAVAGSETAIVYHDMRALRATLAILAVSDPACLDQYMKHFGAIDIFRAAWFGRFDSLGTEGIVTSEQLREPFGPDEVELLRLLAPHLQRAVYIHRRFADLEGRQRASLDALDYLQTGVILLDQRCKAAAMNREAERAIALNDGLSVREGGLAAAHLPTNRELHRLMGCAASVSRGVGAGGPLAVPRPSGKRPFSLLVGPVSDRAFPSDIATPAAIVFVTDPEEKPEERKRPVDTVLTD